MHIFGLSCYYHDAAAALLRAGVLVAAAEEKGFSRIKHDYGFPENATQFCLDQAGLEGRELDYVVFLEKPGNRSIFADPGNPEMEDEDKDIVNAKIKFREPYRRFAQSVLAECAGKYFDLAQAQCHHPAGSMLYVAPVREGHRNISEANRS